MGDTVIGLVGDGFVLLAADASANHSILSLKQDEDKILVLDNHKILAANGDAGDRTQFCEYIQKNMALYALRTGMPLTTHGAAHFTRCELATALRKNMYQTNLLLGGYDEKTGPELYYLDYLASMHKMKHGAHGYGAYFALSILDRYYHQKMQLPEAVALMKQCIAEVKLRLVMNAPNFVLKVVDKDGVRLVE
eukprot:gnl/Hemi2/6108_TR2111_c0_g1_i1.p1 gnl/Hemi2/6108_TR2111_c0_g1~~gnl/Hemi2/6108_TR2111_c0_g1_i1.p1  ORF type:complete len:193 (-),score=67.68 gnl/Hemi2/6108_TR2111_c0_g1_i1:204-782(-)